LDVLVPSEIKKEVQMNELAIINKDGILAIDSREVAEMVGKRHSDLLETISVYNKHLLNGKFRSVDFFIPSTYKDSTGPCGGLFCHKGKTEKLSNSRLLKRIFQIGILQNSGLFSVNLARGIYHRSQGPNWWRRQDH